MILSSALTDTTATGKQSFAASAKSQNKDAQAQFGGILSTLSDASSTANGSGETGDPSKAIGADITPVTILTAFDVAVSGALGADASLSTLKPSAGPSQPTSLAADTNFSANHVPLSIDASLSNAPFNPVQPKTGGILIPAASSALPVQASNTVDLEPSASHLTALAVLQAATLSPSESGASSVSPPAAVTKRASDAKVGVPAAVEQQQTPSSDLPSPAALISGLLGLVPTPLQTPVSMTSATPASGKNAPLPGATATTLDGANPLPVTSAVGIGMNSPVSASTGSASKDEDAFSRQAPMVKSVTVETQLAPAPLLSPMQQVIDTVKKLVPETGPAASATPSAATATATTTASRTMTLVLEPENLGTVTVRMQMRGNTLDLQLDVANVQTLGMLTKDKNTLSAAMSGSDYAIGTLTVRASETSQASQGSDNGNQSSNQGSGGQMSSSRNDNGAPDGGTGQGGGSSLGSGRDDRGTRRDTAPADDQNAPYRARADAAPSSGVYI